jgi:O-6-methylguanine DNA methyltransferase
MVGGMRAARTEYEVQGWGVGELWVGDGLVLVHEFAFDLEGTDDLDAGVGARAGGLVEAAADVGARAGGLVEAAANVGARPPKGAHGPPTGTVPGYSVRVGHDFARTLQPVPQQADRGSETGRDPLGGIDPGVGTEPAPDADLDADVLVERFAAFFAGKDPGLDDVPIDLGWATPFQRAVARTLRAVPRGEVVSYGELAALAGYPGAARAAGGFCAGNRFMLLVPCHRVVGATGLGGYGSAGLGVKRRLLELEGVRL